MNISGHHSTSHHTFHPSRIVLEAFILLVIYRIMRL